MMARVILDKLHESGKGFITVDSPRTTGRGSTDPDVSALHYSSFIVADLASEKSYRGGGSRVPNLRLFEKEDLAVPPLGDMNYKGRRMNELRFLSEDKKLQELLIKMIRGDNLSDVDKRRAPYVSRVHENIVTGSEYENMRRSIMTNELLLYRAEKKRLDKMLLSEHR